MYFLPKVCVAALLLSLAAAAPTPEECGALSQTLSAEELHRIFGKWILHEAYVLSGSDYSSAVQNINSSQIELIPSDNNQTVTLKQAFMKEEGCIRYSLNFTVGGNKMQVKTTRVNVTSDADFLKTCDDCLMMRHTTTRQEGKKGTYLLFYKKTNELPQVEQERVKQQAECLGFMEPPQFSYKQAELCPEQDDATEAEQ